MGQCHYSMSLSFKKDGTLSKSPDESQGTMHPSAHMLPSWSPEASCSQEEPATGGWTGQAGLLGHPQAQGTDSPQPRARLTLRFCIAGAP